MIVSLDSGILPGDLAALSPRRRAAMRWVEYARAVAGPEGFPSTDIPKGAPVEARLAMQQQRAQVGRLRSLLYPEDTDGDA